MTTSIESMTLEELRNAKRKIIERFRTTEIATWRDAKRFNALCCAIKDIVTTRNSLKTASPAVQVTDADFKKADRDREIECRNACIGIANPFSIPKLIAAAKIVAEKYGRREQISANEFLDLVDALAAINDAIET